MHMTTIAARLLRDDNQIAYKAMNDLALADYCRVKEKQFPPASPIVQDY
jgi:hypothetical protein